MVPQKQAQSPSYADPLILPLLSASYRPILSFFANDSLEKKSFLMS